MLGEDVATEVLKLVHAQDPMKKYLATNKGKIAKKKANDNYCLTHKRERQSSKDTTEDVSQWLTGHVEDEINERMSECTSNAEDAEWMKLNPTLFRTGSELWKSYKLYSDSKVTRIRFLSLLAPFDVCPYIVRDGKKVYTPAYAIPFIDFYTLGDE
jgi:hypothetical protein